MSVATSRSFLIATENSNTIFRCIGRIIRKHFVKSRVELRKIWFKGDKTPGVPKQHGIPIAVSIKQQTSLRALYYVLKRVVWLRDRLKAGQHRT